MCLRLGAMLLLISTVTGDRCTTPNNEVGECISLSSCFELARALATNLKEVREFVNKSNCGGTDTDPLVCCGSASRYPPSSSVATPQNDTQRSLLADRRYCGYQRKDDYIHSENDTSIDEVPWLAALLYMDKGHIRGVCSGSLISNRYVLTAAHCMRHGRDVDIVSGSLDVVVRLGENNFHNETDCTEEYSKWYECTEPPQDFRIEKIVMNSRWDERTFANDIALLRLNDTVTFSDFIRPICLPEPGRKSATVGELLISFGWWENYIKKKKLVELIANDECIAEHRLYKQRLTDNHLCTRELELDDNFICTGDSGGPVMYSHRNQWQQEGVLSFGVGCNIGFTEAYIKLVNYLEWIKENVEP